MAKNGRWIARINLAMTGKGGFSTLFPAHCLMRYGYVYILCNRKNGTLYLGVTSNLSERVSEHKAKRNEGFSATYDVTRLVWFTRFDLIVDAIAREKTMKGWPRQWKINLIEETNPDWDELVMDFDD